MVLGTYGCLSVATLRPDAGRCHGVGRSRPRAAERSTTVEPHAGGRGAERSAVHAEAAVGCLREGREAREGPRAAGSRVRARARGGPAEGPTVGPTKGAAHRAAEAGGGGRRGRRHTGAAAAAAAAHGARAASRASAVRLNSVTARVRVAGAGAATAPQGRVKARPGRSTTRNKEPLISPGGAEDHGRMPS